VASPAETHPENETYPGLVILRFDGALFFATAGSLRTRIRELTTDVQPPVRAVILDLESTNAVDLEGSDELAKVARELQEVGVALYLARVKRSVLETLERDGAFAVINRDHVCGHVHEAVTDVVGSS
jgi:sulfate permease, SulP family